MRRKFVRSISRARSRSRIQGLSDRPRGTGSRAIGGASFRGFEVRSASKAVLVARPCDFRSASEPRHRSADRAGHGRWTTSANSMAVPLDGTTASLAQTAHLHDVKPSGRDLDVECWAGSLPTDSVT